MASHISARPFLDRWSFQPTVKGELDKEDREVCGLQEMESHVARKAA